MGQLIGTLAYTAPEEILAAEPRGDLVDVYSLGCVLYEALTGAQPFVRERGSTSSSPCRRPPPESTVTRSDLPAGIDDVIARAMAISAGERIPAAPSSSPPPRPGARPGGLQSRVRLPDAAESEPDRGAAARATS